MLRDSRLLRVSRLLSPLSPVRMSDGTNVRATLTADMIIQVLVHLHQSIVFRWIQDTFSSLFIQHQKLLKYVLITF